MSKVALTDRLSHQHRRLPVEKETRMPDDDQATPAHGAGSLAIDRRTLLVGAVGTVAAAGLSGPARAAGHAGSVVARSGPRFDPHLARQFQKALHDALRDPSIHAPGAILH